MTKKQKLNTQVDETEAKATAHSENTQKYGNPPKWKK